MAHKWTDAERTYINFCKAQIDIREMRWEDVVEALRKPGSQTVGDTLLSWTGDPDLNYERVRGQWRRSVEVPVQVTISEQVQFERQIEKFKRENSNLKKKYKDALRYQDLEDSLIDAVGEWCVAFDPVPPPAPAVVAEKVVDESAVSLLSDTHFWEEVRADETGGLGEYNMKIAAGYMQFYCEKSIDITSNKLKGYRFRNLHELWLGDFVSTNIHRVMESSPGTAVDSLMEGEYLAACYLLDKCRHYEHVHVTGVVGNHGRLTKDKHYTRRYTNFDYVLYNNVAMMLANQPNITFDFPKSFWRIVDIEGNKFLILHGDDIRSWNQIPWYGIDRAVRKFRELLSAHGMSFDYVVMGHFHSTGELEMCRGEKLLNGSMIGSNNFSIGKLATGNLPHQTIFGVHKEHGVSWRYHLELKEPKKLRYTIDPYEQIHKQWRAMVT